MKDPRAIISGIIAALAIIAGTIITIITGIDAAKEPFGLAGIALAYAVGLYSEPRDGAA
jgi:hypothetical protein